MVGGETVLIGKTTLCNDANIHANLYVAGKTTFCNTNANKIGKYDLIDYDKITPLSDEVVLIDIILDNLSSFNPDKILKSLILHTKI